MAEKSPYQVLFEQIDNPMLILDAQTNILDLNLAAQQLFNADLMTVVGLPIIDVMSYKLDDTFSLDAIPDTPIQLKVDEQSYYFHLELKTLPNNMGYALIFEETTELTQLKNDYSEFAHTLGHDLKNPLGVAIGYSNILQADMEAGTEERFFVDEIFETSMRIMDICNELVLLADIRFEKHVEVMPVNLQVLFNKAMRRFAHELEKRKLTVNVPDDLPFTKGNAPWVEEVIVNFLAFAVLKNPSSTAIIIDINNNKDMIQFTINHNGDNVLVTHLDEIIPEVFDVRDIRAEGYGLGLGIAKTLLDKMDGELGLIDEQTLYFALPIAET